MTLFIPDCSNNQWGSRYLTPEGRAAQGTFLTSLISSDFDALEHKMSEGSTYTDPYGAIAQDFCKSNKFPFLGYHYATTDNPSAQAANWIASGGGVNAMIDFEQVDGNQNPLLTPDDFWPLVNAFNSAGINVPLTYVPEWYADDIGIDLSALSRNGISLISSAYPLGYSEGPYLDLYKAAGGDIGEGWASYRGGLPVMWQYTSSATVGIFQRVDINAYRGTTGQLANLIGIN